MLIWGRVGGLKVSEVEGPERGAVAKAEASKEASKIDHTRG